MRRTDSIEVLKGIGKSRAEAFAKLGIHTVGDLLEDYPARYEEMPPAAPIASFGEGRMAAVCCTLSSAPRLVSTAKGALAVVSVADGSARLSLDWFNQPYMAKILKKGDRRVFRGVILRRTNGLSMMQPQVFSEEEYAALAGRPRPVYLTVRGLPVNTIRQAARQALAGAEDLQDLLPESIRQANALCSFEEALWGIHAPQSMEQLRQAHNRLVFDEFLAFILRCRLLRAPEKIPNTFPVERTAWAEKVLATLPYALTGAQERVWSEILDDLQGPSVMNRLVQGDVGSGKTVLALLALVSAAENGFQGALMAPTEVLARQHFDKITALLQGCGLSCPTVLLTGSTRAKERREIGQAVADGSARIVIGTHALFQEKVDYARLGLVITDEQHRFGVQQRLRLSDKGADPHVLVMSATPIPRTLAMILYGDLDVSAVDEKPANRLPIKNAVIPAQDRDKAVRFLAGQVAAGRQGYVICPLVEESEGLDAEDVKSCRGRLRKALPGVSVEMLHGRMKPAEKQRIMEGFAAGRIQVLVSTTVIEVGVDVPNATVMIVENAERFGLAQLHQLRGRIGRGAEQSYCVFVNGSEESGENRRLEVLQKENDGFKIAEADLKLRGPGDFFGVRQSGEVLFRLGDVLGDSEVLGRAAAAADDLTARARESDEARTLVEKLVGEAFADVFVRPTL